MDDEKYMNLAIEEAKKAKSAGGPPIGTVIVKQDKLVAAGWSSVGKDLDPSGHNDINCIRAACKALQSLDLSGCTMYSTIEPCSMCFGCAAWTGISRIVFGAYQEDIKENPYERVGYHAEESGKTVSPTPIVVCGGVLRDTCKELMSGYKNWGPAR